MKPTPEALQSLIEPGKSNLIDISFELAYQRAGAVFYEANAIGGDFIYFPPAWLHKVKTYEKSIGMGGYIQLEATLHETAAILAHLEHLERT